MPSLTILIRILVSTFLAALIGIEREVHGCAAGLRTHILVCIGSTLFMLTSIAVAADYSHVGVGDPSRIAAGVVTGIGFLGAGAIIRYGASIRGLTTAASIWAVSAIGLATGAGMYEAAFIVTGVVLAVLILSRLEERMELKRYGEKLVVRMRADGGVSVEDMRNVIETYGGKIKRIIPVESNDGEVFTFEVMLSRIYRKDVVAEISSLSGVKGVSWRKREGLTPGTQEIRSER